MSSILSTLPRRLAAVDVRPSFELIRGSVPPLSKMGFTSLIAVILGFTVAAQVALHVFMSQGAFTEQNLMWEVRTSQAQVQSLQQQVTVMGAPATLQERARKLGMVPMTTPVFLRISDSKILGIAKPAIQSAAKKTNVPTMSHTDVALTADGAHVVQIEQLPTDDGAVIVNSKATK
ncbi:MAG: hypothetical protein RL410_940 [Actinomycetota bacterium]